MKLYLLQRKDEVYLDEFLAKIVRAKNATQARRIANKETGDEGNVWHFPLTTSCVRLKEDGKACVILADFNAGQEKP